MHRDDQKRLAREAQIAKSTRGPDYSSLEGEIAANKTQHAKNTETQIEVDQRVQRGVRLNQSYYKALERMATAVLPVDQTRDQGQER